jgi:hypothetical protein
MAPKRLGLGMHHLDQSHLLTEAMRRYDGMLHSPKCDRVRLTYCSRRQICGRLLYSAAPTNSSQNQAYNRHKRISSQHSCDVFIPYAIILRVKWYSSIYLAEKQ